MDLRKRILATKEDSEDEEVSMQSIVKSRPLEGEDTDSACGDLDDEIVDEDVASMIPQHVITFADSLLSGFSPRWRNWIVRIISGLTLISGFSLLVWMGPAGLIFLTYLVMCSSYSEVLSLGKRFCNIRDQSTIRMAWIFFLIVEYFLVAPKVLNAIKENASNFEVTAWTKNILNIAKFMASHHEAIVFFSYLMTFVWFILSMRPNDYLRRYGFFAWSHMATFFLCIPGQMMNLATFGGMMWYVIPMSVITINDIAAYMVGFFVGKTPLIKLSPKKTKEGFIGGGLITIILGTAFSLWISLMPGMTCPVNIGPNFTLHVTDCVPPEIFRPYSIRLFNVINVTWNDFAIHGFLISIFSSIVGPCGGFFASGFKRACRRKNFGSFIPGHGGVLDRCDCMFLMAAFTYIYQRTILP